MGDKKATQSLYWALGILQVPISLLGLFWCHSAFPMRTKGSFVDVVVTRVCLEGFGPDCSIAGASDCIRVGSESR